MHAPLQDVPGRGLYDYIISGIPLNNFPLSEVREIFQSYPRLLKPNGILSYFEYVAVRDLKRPFLPARDRRRLRVLGRFLDRRIRAYQIRQQWVFMDAPPPSPATSAFQANRFVLSNTAWSAQRCSPPAAEPERSHTERRESFMSHAYSCAFLSATLLIGAVSLVWSKPPDLPTNVKVTCETEQERCYPPSDPIHGTPVCPPGCPGCPAMPNYPHPHLTDPDEIEETAQPKSDFVKSVLELMDKWIDQASVAPGRRPVFTLGR